jgi:hypothetical protein
VHRLLKPRSVPRCTVGMVRFLRPHASSTQVQVSPQLHSGHGQDLEASCKKNALISELADYRKCNGVGPLTTNRQSGTH